MNPIVRWTVRWRTALMVTALLAITTLWFTCRGHRNQPLGLEKLQVVAEDLHDVIQIEPITTEQEMSNRLDHLRSQCVRHEVSTLRRGWYAASNKQDHSKGCSTKLCPLLVDEEHLLLMCFVQKVASSSLKVLFLTLGNKTIIHLDNSTAFHLYANDQILRVSASFFPEYKMRRFLKGLFVRHPFERLVSAYADKAAPGSRKRPYFYNKYFTPAMKKIRGKIGSDDIITFKEFVEYLITTQPLYYDEHWMPYWSRCDVCRTSYDFVGRLETANQDAEFLLRQLGFEGQYKLSMTNVSLRELTKKYFSQLSKKQVVELYKTYFLDFKLFGYEVKSYFPESENITSIDESVELFKLLF